MGTRANYWIAAGGKIELLGTTHMDGGLKTTAKFLGGEKNYKKWLGAKTEAAFRAGFTTLARKNTSLLTLEALLKELKIPTGEIETFDLSDSKQAEDWDSAEGEFDEDQGYVITKKGDKIVVSRPLDDPTADWIYDALQDEVGSDWGVPKPGEDFGKPNYEYVFDGSRVTVTPEPEDDMDEEVQPVKHKRLKPSALIEADGKVDYSGMGELGDALQEFRLKMLPTISDVAGKLSAAGTDAILDPKFGDLKSPKAKKRLEQIVAALKIAGTWDTERFLDIAEDLEAEIKKF